MEAQARKHLQLVDRRPPATPEEMPDDRDWPRTPIEVFEFGIAVVVVLIGTYLFSVAMLALDWLLP